MKMLTVGCLVAELTKGILPAINIAIVMNQFTSLFRKVTQPPSNFPEVLEKKI